MALDTATLSAYSTVATTLATIFLVGVTAFLVLATNQLTGVTKKMWLAQDNPRLHFYTVIQESGFVGTSPLPTLYLHVKNIGKGPALEIRFNVDVINQHLPQIIIALSPHEEKKIMGLPNRHGEVHIREINYEDINGMPKNPSDVDLTY
jgi:hypothetical protein